jgi:hypothetical protein
MNRRLVVAVTVNPSFKRTPNGAAEVKREAPVRGSVRVIHSFSENQAPMASRLALR